LSSEVNLSAEQAHLEEARRIYAGNAQVLVPRLLPFCSRTVTAMERVRGVKVTDVHCSPGKRRSLAATLVNALLAHPLWSEGPRTLFHADPHAGNLFETADGRLALLDWSLVGRLGAEERVGFMQIALAALGLDASGIIRALGRLALRPVDSRRVDPILDEALGQVRHGRFPGFSWGLDLMDRLAVSGAVQFSEDLLFFRKATLSLSGVLADVDESYSLDAGLLTAASQAFVKDLPARIWTSVDSRDFRVPVSTADLAMFGLGAPLATAQACAGWWREALDGVAAALTLS
jgi:ubiquinone biosynthesis protein